MKILVFSPHNDDEVLGMGGTIAGYVREGHQVYVCVAANGTGDDAAVNERDGRRAHEILGVTGSWFLNLTAMGLKDMGVVELNGYLERIADQIRPDLAFIPHKGDIHMDHSVLARSAMVALRPQYHPQLRAILAYETLSETEWAIPTADNVFVPTVWNDISSTIEKKLEAFGAYTLQRRPFPHPRSEEAIRALARLRGSNVCVDYAEAFMLLRGRLM